MDSGWTTADEEAGEAEAEGTVLIKTFRLWFLVVGSSTRLGSDEGFWFCFVPGSRALSFSREW